MIRLGSVIGFVLTLITLWYLLKKCFCIKYPLGACAFYANMPFILKYSNVFKQYISEAFFVMYGICKLFCRSETSNFQIYVMGAIICILVFSNKGIFTYLNRENVYWSQEELNPEIQWLLENIEKDDKIYVFIGAVNGFQYKNGYGDYSFGGFKDNVILGTTNFIDGSDYEEELKQIISHDKIYIVCSHYGKDEYIANLLDAIYENGYLQLVSFEYETPLWFYCSDLSNGKIRVSYEAAESSETGDFINMIVRVHNIGEAYLNHNWEFDPENMKE